MKKVVLAIFAIALVVVTTTAQQKKKGYPVKQKPQTKKSVEKEALSLKGIDTLLTSATNLSEGLDALTSSMYAWSIVSVLDGSFSATAQKVLFPVIKAKFLLEYVKKTDSAKARDQFDLFRVGAYLSYIEKPLNFKFEEKRYDSSWGTDLDWVGHEDPNSYVYRKIYCRLLKGGMSWKDFKKYKDDLYALAYNQGTEKSRQLAMAWITRYTQGYLEYPAIYTVYDKK